MLYITYTYTHATRMNTHTAHTYTHTHTTHAYARTILCREDNCKQYLCHCFWIFFLVGGEFGGGGA